jgi:hypothetical protein
MPNALLGSEVRVAGAGHVWAAPEGEAIPTDLTAPPPGFVDMGYVTTDGVGFTFSRESEDLDAWQGDKVRVLSSREPMTLTFALMQTNADSLLLALGGGAISELSPGIFEYLPVAGENLVRTLIVDFADGTLNYRYVIPRAQVEGDVTWTLVRTDALTYPITFGVLANEPKYRIVSDDPAMGEGSLPGAIGGGSGGQATASIEAAPAAGPTGEAQGSLIVDSSTGDVWVVNTSGEWEDSTIVVAPIPASVGLTTVDPTVTPPAGTWVADDVVWHDDGTNIYKAFVYNGTTWAAETGSNVDIT